MLTSNLCENSSVFYFAEALDVMLVVCCTGGWRVMGPIAGLSRDQRQLVAPSLDELVGADHGVRVIDAFVDSLNLAALGFSKVAALATGRPPFHPSALLKLYLYGYMNRTRSRRSLEREAARNIEVQWLINQLQPSFRTIADFRQAHSQAIVASEPSKSSAHKPYCTRSNLKAHEHDQTYLRTATSQKLRNQIKRLFAQAGKSA